MEILDELQIVIWIFWNCLLLAMFDVDKIPEDVEFNKKNEHFIHINLSCDWFPYGVWMMTFFGAPSVRLQRKRWHFHLKLMYLLVIGLLSLRTCWKEA